MIRTTQPRGLLRRPLDRRGFQLALLAAALLPVALAGGLERSPEADQNTRAAVRDVVALFEKTPVVAIGEVHGMNEQHAFLRALIADPAFGRKVQVVVVEFGNALYQPVADAYVLNRQPVSRTELRPVWRNSTQSAWNTWDAPIYEQFFRAVRAANLARPRGRPQSESFWVTPPLIGPRSTAKPTRDAFSTATAS